MARGLFISGQMILESFAGVKAGKTRSWGGGLLRSRYLCVTTTPEGPEEAVEILNESVPKLNGGAL